MSQATATRSIKATDAVYRRLKMEAGRKGVRLIDLLDQLTAHLPDPDAKAKPSRSRRRVSA